MSWLRAYIARRRRNRAARRAVKRLFRATYPRTRIRFTKIAERREAGLVVVAIACPPPWGFIGTDFYFFLAAPDGVAIECPTPASWGPIR